MPTPTPIRSDMASVLASIIAANCQGAKQTSSGWVAQCPTHDDSTPSLSIDPGHDRVLLLCRAGCPTEGVLAALGKTWADLFIQPKGSGFGELGDIVATYDYVDLSGTLLHQTVRFLSPAGKKNFRQRRPDPGAKYGWKWSIKGIPHVLYNLPTVTQAIQTEQTIYVVEGEKDADTLGALGLVATTNAMGANSWEAGYNESLRGAHLVLLPDYDPAGHTHMHHIAQRLYGLAASIKLLPDIHTATAKSDVSDWLAAGGSRAALETAAANAPAWNGQTASPLTALPPSMNGTGAANTPQPPEPPGFGIDPDGLYTDTYNARALIKAHGADLRYCYAWKCWLVWTGTHWQRDSSGEVMRRGKQVIRELAKLLPLIDDTQVAAFLGHLRASLSTAKLKAMLDNAQSEPGVAVQPEDFDRDLWLLNCANGTIDLRTGTLRPHARADLITKCLSIPYDPTASCPKWEAFLTRAMSNKQGLVAFLHRAVGYSLTGSTIEQCLFILHGPTKTGKSTFLTRLRALLGPYGTQADMESFMHKDRAEVRNDLADLAGRRVVCAVESQEGRRLNENLIKQLTGGVDAVKARFLFEEYFTYTPQYKIFLASNHKPVIKDSDQAIWERIRLVPFIVQIPVGERDKRLDDALQQEVAGILAWAVRGCLAWQLDGGLAEPPEVIAATEAYQAEMDVLGRFIVERCDTNTRRNPMLQVQAKALYDAYKTWCEESGERWDTQTAFGRKMVERGYEKVARHFIIYLGIGLKDMEEHPEPGSFDA